MVSDGAAQVLRGAGLLRGLHPLCSGCIRHGGADLELERLMDKRGRDRADTRDEPQVQREAASP